ncbi:MAG: bile acid:sodium symporter, partial [Magnetospiraceae bacterium]
MGKILPIGLALAITAAWLAPAPGIWVDNLGIIPYLIVAVFVANGYQINLRQRPQGRELLTASVSVSVINLVVAPVLGFWFASLLSLSPGATLGLVVMTAMPTTLSSAIVLTGVAGGDLLWALLLTVILNILGVLTIPITVPWLLSLGGGIDIDGFTLFKNLVLLALIPFAAGQIIRRIVGPGKWQPLLKYGPTCCIISMVWMTMARSAEALTDLAISTIVLAAIGSLAVHALLLGGCLAAARGIGLPARAVPAYVLTGSQ